MITLQDILYKVSLKTTSGDMGIQISGVQFDSRKVTKGDLFVAVKGLHADGHAYISEAIDNGACAIVCESEVKPIEDITIARTDNSARALGIIAANFYDNPSSKLQLVGVTGTNGKTTVATLLYSMFRKLGYHAGLLSTIHNKINDSIIASTHTTADAIQINQLLKKMVDAGCTHCFMEVSSHAIEQERIAGLQFNVAVFTNITHDHLDYHKTFDAYIRAKKKFFDELSSTAFALVNKDDKRWSVMLQNSSAQKKTYGVKSIADFKAKIISDTLQGLELEIDGRQAWFNMIGSFNASNILAAYGVGVLLNENPEDILLVLSAHVAVPGRFEKVTMRSKINAIVDYAHTPDALKNVLGTITTIRTRNEQLITVIGCGGDRDKQKRPTMAEIASRLSNRVIFTSDNPRNEEPEAIIADMTAGVPPQFFRKTLTIVDRKEAIKTALALAKDNDIVLVAGKGHEDYQEIKGERRYFSDKEVLIELESLMYDNQTGKA
jgi:UDP-N-acetylmuramoyl-L-alanyl-D-glutamate--2,6-diaminopimelate ligase